MPISRRRLIKLAGAAARLPAAPQVTTVQVAKAQGDYPARPVKLIVGQAAGSATDIIARPWRNGCRSGSASSSSWRPGRARAAISRRRR